MTRITLILLVLVSSSLYAATGDYHLMRKTSGGFEEVIVAPGTNNILTTNGTGVIGVTAQSAYALSTITVNGQALTSNVSITSVTGNAGTATALATGRTINGTTFDGTANITITAAAGTLTGTTLASGVTASSLTSVGTLGSLGVTGTVTAGAFSGPLTGNVTGNVTGSSGSTTGNAATATALQTARTINGVSFDGTGNITVTAAGSTLSDTVTIAKGGTGQTTAAAARVALLPSMASNGGKFLRVNTGETDYELATISGGGDVLGPASATDNAVARFDTTTGKLLQNSAVTIADTTGNITGGTYNGVSVWRGPNTDTTSVGVGSSALATLNAGTYYNAAFGTGALQNATTGARNTAVGYSSMNDSTLTGSYNTGVGYSSLLVVGSGNYNTACGYQSGLNVNTGGSNVFLGAFAGAYETGSNSFYVDNQNRADTAGDKAKALLYGTFNASAASQQLTVNAGTLNLPSAVIELGHATDTTLARSSSGNVSIEGNVIYRAGGTDVTVSDGGTGVSTLTAYAPIFGGTTSTGAVQSGTVGTAGQVLTSNGAGALPTFQAASGGLPRSYLAGLGLANNGTDANNDIDIAVGTARDSTNTYDITLASAITKQLDASWSVGTGAGGLDTGTEAVSTWYHVFAIRRSDTGVVDVLFSTSATSPTMPTNYDAKRRIGAIYNDSSGNIVAFYQNGDTFMRKSLIQDVFVTNLGTSATLYTLSVPTGVIVEAIFDAYTTKSSAYFVIISSPNANDDTPSTNLFTNSGSNSANAHPKRLLTNTSGQIRARSSVATTTLYLHTNGWVDKRGKDD